MKEIKVLVSAFIIAFICFGCKQKEKSTEHLKQKIYKAKGEGWKSKVAFHSLGGINYKATQVPIQYYFIKNETVDPQKVDSLYQLNKQERVVEFEFSNVNKDDVLKSKFTKKSYKKSVEYMAFTIENDFEVITSSGKTVKCSGVTFERNFKLAPFKRILLFFTGVPEGDDIKLVYNDKLYGNGLLKFRFGEKPIKL